MGFPPLRSTGERTSVTLDDFGREPTQRLVVGFARHDPTLCLPIDDLAAEVIDDPPTRFVIESAARRKPPLALKLSYRLSRLLIELACVLDSKAEVVQTLLNTDHRLRRLQSGGERKQEAAIRQAELHMLGG